MHHWQYKFVLSTGESLGSLLSDATGNTVAKTIVDNIPTDPTVFWLMAGFILFFVCALELVVIYVAFYSDVSACRAAYQSQSQPDRVFTGGRP